MEIEICKIREVARTDKVETNVCGYIKAVGYPGFSTKGIKGNKDVFFLDFTPPCIVQVVLNN